MEIYQPSDDSYLLSEVLTNEIKKIIDKLSKKSNNKNLKFLEIGAGSGIQLKTALKSGIEKENIFAVDINPEAVKHCKSLGFSCKRSHLFDKIHKNHNFDIIVFNPPYLPEDKYDKKPDTSGGKKGNETINLFLKQAKNYLAENGTIFLLTSSLTPNFNYSGYKRKLLAKKKIFFEELYVWELKA